MMRLLAICLLVVLVGPNFTRAAPVLPAPPCLIQKEIYKKSTPLEIANCFLGIPYRPDGALDLKGRFTTFKHPDRFFRSPGLNCSGLILGLTRFLLDKNISIQEASGDRWVDSGPDSDWGEDWDFGWDLIFNLTEGLPRQVIWPEGRETPPLKADGEILRGFDLNDRQAWSGVLGLIRPGYFYLASFSRANRKNKIHLQHYHVALLLSDGQGGVWLYQTTGTAGTSYRINLKTRRGLSRLLKGFAQASPKKILILEAPLEKTCQPDPGGGLPVQ